MRSIAARNFKLWSSDLYRNEFVEKLEQDGEIAKVRIVAEFKIPPSDDWVERSADITCKKVNNQWGCDQDFDFQLTPVQLDKNASLCSSDIIKFGIYIVLPFI